MKRLSLIYFFGAALCTSAAQVVVPETSELLNANVIYDRGEMAVLPNKSQHVNRLGRGMAETNICHIAELFVGDENGKPLKVADSAALRARQMIDLVEGEYSVQVGGDVASLGGGVYQVNMPYTTNAWLRFHPHGGRKIGDVEFATDQTKIVDPGTSPNVAEYDIWRTRYVGDYLEIYAIEQDFDKKAGRWDCRIFNIKPKVVSEDTKGWVNDLVQNDFVLKDSLGVISFGTLRDWAAHLYDGNRGADWAKYPATHKVNLYCQELAFDRARNFTFKANDNQLVGEINKQEALRFDFTTLAGTAPDVTGIFVRSIATSNLTVSLATEFVLAGGKTLDWNKVSVMYTPSLGGEEEWDGLMFTHSPAAVGSDGATYYDITVAKPSGAAFGFYKIMYDDIAVSYPIAITFKADLKVLGDLYLKGDDGVTYRIKVNAGALSAEAQN